MLIDAACESGFSLGRRCATEAEVARALAGYGIVRKAGWRESDHPRGQPENAGQFATVPGGRGAQARGGTATRPARRRAGTGKSVARLNRFTSLAVKRRVLHGLRNEREMADALSMSNLPDSEPADVVLAITPWGEVLSDPAEVKEYLGAREAAVKLLRDVEAGGGAGQFHSPSALESIARAREIAGGPLHFFEVKTLVTQHGQGHVTMSKKAADRKRTWERKYAATFHTVAFDDRRSHHASGHRLYYRRGVGSAKLSAMERIDGFEDILSKAGV